MLKADADYGRLYDYVDEDFLFSTADFAWLKNGGEKARAGDGESSDRFGDFGIDHLYGKAGLDQLFGDADAATNDGVGQHFALSELNNGETNVIDARGRFEQKVLDGVEKIAVAANARNYLGDDDVFTTLDLLDKVVRIDAKGEGRGDGARPDKAGGEGSHAGRDNPTFGQQMDAYAEYLKAGGDQQAAADGAEDAFTASSLLGGDDLLV